MRSEREIFIFYFTIKYYTEYLREISTKSDKRKNVEEV